MAFNDKIMASPSVVIHKDNYAAQDVETPTQAKVQGCGCGRDNF
jgi:hypothetical protein